MLDTWLSMCVQISGDLERSMNDVFAKYNGDDAEGRAVDYLQNQVGVVFRCTKIVLFSRLILRPLPPVLRRLLSLSLACFHFPLFARQSVCLAFL